MNTTRSKRGRHRIAAPALALTALAVGVAAFAPTGVHATRGTYAQAIAAQEDDVPHAPQQGWRADPAGPARYGYGPGMAAHGYGYGPGMMGGYGPGMPGGGYGAGMMNGYGYGPGMMGGYGPGMPGGYGHGPGMPWKGYGPGPR